MPSQSWLEDEWVTELLPPEIAAERYLKSRTGRPSGRADAAAHAGEPTCSRYAQTAVGPLAKNGLLEREKGSHGVMDSTSGVKNGPYQLFMLGLCFFVLGLLAVDALLKLDPEARQVLLYGDLGICVLFFVDFLVSFYRAPNRLEYFVKWGWIDLVSSIPMLDYVRWGRMARIFRIFRVLRAVRAAKVLAEFVLSKRAESAFLAATLVSILVLILSSIAILQFERGPETNIKSAEDAIWWTFVTMTTVGYGDKFPVTTEGRIVAAGVMVMGVGLFGTFTGFIASWFLSGEGQDSELKSIKRELEEIKLALRGKVAEVEEERSDQLKRKDRCP